jgi:hypothetical protein
MPGMFCPVCHAEYRPGFTRCSDCQVDLVRELPASSGFLSKAIREDEDSGEHDAMEVLWAGVDPRVQSRIADALTEAAIDYDDEAAKSFLLPAAAGGMLEIRVLASDLAAARKAVAAAQGDDEGDEAAAPPEFATASNDPFRQDQQAFHAGPAGNAPTEALAIEEDDTDQPEDDYVEEHFDQDEATAEAWSGDSEDMADIFRNCLDNIGIGCVIEEENGKVRVLVMPASEKRAKEVIREISEAAPME